MEWPHWSIYIILPVAWLWQNFIHELSHGIALYHYHKKRVLGLHPYPHKHEGIFYFARVCVEPYILPGHPMVHAAPLWGALVQVIGVLLIGAPLLILFEHYWHLVLLFAIPCVDVLWWVRSCRWGRPESDGKRYRVSRKAYFGR